MTRWRSLLFVPGDNPDRIAGAHRRGADAIILDLEDAVAAPNKPAARAGMAGAAAHLAAAGCQVVVRINSRWRDIFADLEAVVVADLAAVMVPKVESLATIETIDAILLELEAERGLPARAIGLLALIESPLGLAIADRVVSCPRMIGLALGTEDFCLALGVSPTPAALALPSRQIALAAATRGAMALAVPISIATIKDQSAYRLACEAGAASGVTGAICVHPDQIVIANRAFATSAKAITDATAILDAWELARQQGLSVISLDGRMIDLPVVERARRILTDR